eukprot:2076010-Rhodomonas_salina.1
MSPYCPSVSCYAVSGTERAYAATRCAGLICYAVSGTELGYGATPCAVLTQRMAYQLCAYAPTADDARRGPPRPPPPPLPRVLLYFAIRPVRYLLQSNC